MVTIRLQESITNTELDELVSQDLAFPPFCVINISVIKSVLPPPAIMGYKNRLVANGFLSLVQTFSCTPAFQFI